MFITEVDLEAFEEDYRDALGYHRRAKQFLDQGQRASLVFNVASVALERYLVALCDLYGVEPMNHNFICLMNAVETIIEVSPELNQEIRSLDFIFGICSLDNYFHGTPETADMHRVLAMCQQVEQLFDQTRISSVRAAG